MIALSQTGANDPSRSTNGGLEWPPEGGPVLPITYGFLSTFPPTQCGLATFTASMMRSLTTSESRDRAGVVRVVDSGAGAPVAGVVEHLDQRPDAVRRAAAALNTFDV